MGYIPAEQGVALSSWPAMWSGRWRRSLQAAARSSSSPGGASASSMWAASFCPAQPLSPPGRATLPGQAGRVHSGRHSGLVPLQPPLGASSMPVARLGAPRAHRAVLVRPGADPSAPLRGERGRRGAAVRSGRSSRERGLTPTRQRPRSSRRGRRRASAPLGRSGSAGGGGIGERSIRGGDLLGCSGAGLHRRRPALMTPAPLLVPPPNYFVDILF